MSQTSEVEYMFKKHSQRSVHSKHIHVSIHLLWM